jgi:hypothetical protein
LILDTMLVIAVIIANLAQKANVAGFSLRLVGRRHGCSCLISCTMGILWCLSGKFAPDWTAGENEARIFAIGIL